jgi:hypothetical protein
MKLIVFKYSGHYVGEVDEGPWYNDSNPEGHGDVPQEAADRAWNELLALQKQVNDFVAQGKPNFELVA